MNPLRLTPALITLLVSAYWSGAQVTNFWPLAPATKLDSLETVVGSVVIKATTEVGSIAAKTGVVAIRCREIGGSGGVQKEQGIVIQITQGSQFRDQMSIDYDEIPALVSGIDYLTKLNLSVTSLNTFDAAFTTKGGFRIAALGNRRTAAIQFAVRDVRIESTPVILSRDEAFRLLALINQAKSTLDSLRGG